MIASRWRAECEARLPPDVNGALVFKFGVNDTAVEPTGPRVSVEHSVAIARAIVTHAAAYKPVLWLGPAPVDDSFSPTLSTTGVRRELRNAAVIATARAYAKIAAELGVPFFNLHAALSREAGVGRFARRRRRRASYRRGLRADGDADRRLGRLARVVRPRLTPVATAKIQP